MLTPAKRTRLAQLLGMMGSNHDGEALNAARLAQRLIGGEAMTWEEVLNGSAGAGVRDGSYVQGYAFGRADGFRDGYREGRSDGFRDGLAKGMATATVDSGKFKPVPSDWQELARSLLEEFELTDWETGFCESFVARGWDEPTEKQRGVFARMCRKFDLNVPE